MHMIVSEYAAGEESAILHFGNASEADGNRSAQLYHMVPHLHRITWVCTQQAQKGICLKGIANSNKELSAARIDCNGSFQVKLSLTAAPDIVSFADTAVQDTQLITSVDDLKAAVNALSAGGSTNHAG